MLPGSGPEAAPRFCVKPDFRGRRKSVAPRFLDRLQVSARSPAGGLELRVSVSLKMADEEAGGAERMEVSTELPQTPQLLASVSPCRQVPFVPPPVPPYRALEDVGLHPLWRLWGGGVVWIDLEGSHRIKVSHYPHSCRPTLRNRMTSSFVSRGEFRHVSILK